MNLLLDNLKSTDTQVGEWVNVIGYVQDDEKATAPRNCNRVLNQKTKASGMNGRVQIVQAVMLWSAGAVKLGEYEKSLEARRASEKDHLGITQSENLK